MSARKEYQKIKIVEIERGWQTLELLQISLVLSAFMAAMNTSGFWHWTWMAAMLVFLFFTVRKIRRLRTHGLKVVIEKAARQTPPSRKETQPAEKTVDIEQDEESEQWFEQPYPDPDEELFPEKFEQHKDEEKCDQANA